MSKSKSKRDMEGCGGWVVFVEIKYLYDSMKSTYNAINRKKHTILH